MSKCHLKTVVYISNLPRYDCGTWRCLRWPSGKRSSTLKFLVLPASPLHGYPLSYVENRGCGVNQSFNGTGSDVDEYMGTAVFGWRTSSRWTSDPWNSGRWTSGRFTSGRWGVTGALFQWRRLLWGRRLLQWRRLLFPLKLLLITPQLYFLLPSCFATDFYSSELRFSITKSPTGKRMMAIVSAPSNTLNEVAHASSGFLWTEFENLSKMTG